MNKRLPFEWCWRWMLCLSLGSVALGVVLMVMPGRGWLAWYDRGMLGPFWSGEVPAAGVGSYRFAMGIVGAGIMGWGVSLSFLAAIPFRRRELWAWWAFACGVATWIGGEVLLCLVWGVTTELVFLAGATVGIGLPLALSWPWFHDPPKPS